MQGKQVRAKPRLCRCAMQRAIEWYEQTREEQHGLNCGATPQNGLAQTERAPSTQTDFLAPGVIAAQSTIRLRSFTRPSEIILFSLDAFRPNQPNRVRFMDFQHPHGAILQGSRIRKF